MPQCSKCGDAIAFIMLESGKWCPVSVALFVRDGSVPLPRGEYLDKQGFGHTGETVPCKLRVWRTHGQDCKSKGDHERHSTA